jgi:hypothetical protein
MNVEVFAEWLRLQGHRVIRTPSSYWVEIGVRVYQAFPYHWLIQPTDKEVYELLSNEKGIGLRYSTPVHKPNGKISYHVVFDDGPYTLDLLSANERRNVRRSLKRCQIERISMKQLAQDGWKLQYDTLDRQGRSRSMSQDIWQRICLAAQDLPGFEAWGAIVEGELAASMLTARIDDTCCLLYSQSHRKYFKERVNNALMYTVSCEMLSRSEVRMVLSGIHSLDAPDSVDEFKFNLGYRAKPVRQRVVFHPWLAPAFNSFSHTIVQQLSGWAPNNPTLAKAEGLIRFYLEGRRPLPEQAWPTCLADYKQEFLLA